MDVFPDFEGLEGIGDLREVVGALLTFVLIIAVLMLIVCAIVWALSTANGHHAAATKARIGAWTALGARSPGRRRRGMADLADRPRPATLNRTISGPLIGSDCVGRAVHLIDENPVSPTPRRSAPP